MRSILLATDGGVPARGDLRLLRRPIVDRAEGETDERESPQSAGGRHVDYALIRLDRKVTGRAVLKVAAKEELFLGKQLFVIGHPSGLPTKLADHASTNQVRATTFRSNLDTFEGNSGSPIFSARSNAIVGVLDGAIRTMSGRASAAS